MECATCESVHRQNYCRDCIQDLVQEHRELKGGLTRLRTEYEQLQRKTTLLRETNNDTRNRLDDAWRSVTTRWQQTIQSRPEYIEQQQKRKAELDKKLLLSRKLLLRELLHVFNVRRVSSRSSHRRSQQTKATAVSEQDSPVYTIRISGLQLPEQADWYSPLYSRNATNTACQMVINMLNLMAYYLNEKLPFTMIDQGTSSFAYRSTAGGDTRSSPLYLTDNNSDQFTRGFAMICYNAAYLCHVRGFKTAIEQSTYILWQLWRCCRGSSIASSSQRSTNVTANNISTIAVNNSNSNINNEDDNNNSSSNSSIVLSCTSTFSLSFDKLVKHLYSLQRATVMRESVCLVERDETGTMLLPTMETWDLVEMPLPPTPAQVAELEMWRDSQRQRDIGQT
ncbi:UV radiation resistance protein and autophagy-related subunit 14-domain-containing protein [Syncephalis fuscata]|nr:UV radiation resistance protein and autophagy-related subunit 14-domain-containing protein [Syncephalis fuscata]